MKYLIFTTFILLLTIVISQSINTNSSNKNKKADSLSDINTIEYEVLDSRDGFEIRKYPELTVAKTKLNSSSYSSNSNAGFRKIASYIFGGNSSNEQIAMTSPVQMDMGPDPTMSFYMPDNANPSDLPTPNRSDVVVEIQPAKIVAVIEFSGWASDKVLANKFNLLKSKLQRDSIEFENTYSFLGYNPPYKLMNRKNEVIIPLLNFNN